MKRVLDVICAAFAAGLCHGGFLAAVSAMAIGLAMGMQTGWGRLDAPWDVVFNSALIVQFPLLHSILLTARGRRFMARMAPGDRGRTLAPTTFATIASAQLALLFLAWTPSGVVWFAPIGPWGFAAYTVFACSWVFLVRALLDAGMSLQTGSIGWWALMRGARPTYPPLPTRGLFRICRQPIYLAFFLILWTAPTWTPDHLALALAWSPYCLLAPRLKERRFLSTYGEAFVKYRERVPYFFPTLPSKSQL